MHSSFDILSGVYTTDLHRVAMVRSSMVDGSHQGRGTSEVSNQLMISVLHTTCHPANSIRCTASAGS